MPAIRVLAAMGLGLFFAASASGETAEEFAARMSDVRLVGQFSVDDPRLTNAPPRRDTYRIASIEPVRDDQFRVNAKIEYKKADGTPVDVTVPIFVRIDFTTGTPLLSVTDLKIPLLGEGFSSRVVFDGDRYAGTWQHGEVGGHMWGVIRAADVDDASPESDVDAGPSDASSPE